MADQRVITLYQGDGTPKDIVLRELPVATPSAGTTIYLYAGDATPKDVVLRDPTAAPVSGGSDLDFDIDTAGAITIAGQAVTASVSQSLTNGALAIAGQTVTAGIGQSLDAGALTLAGQSLSAGIGIEIGGSASGITGGDVTAGISQALSDAALSLTGGDLTASFAVSLDAGAIVLAGGDVTASTSGAAPVTDSIGGGGWRWDSEYDRYLDRKRKKRKREIELEEAEEQAQQLRATEREIATLLHEQEKQDLERAESERLLRMARRYADSVEIADKLREAMAKAAALETFGALEALKRELERTAEEEEVALLLILNQ